MPLRLAVRPCTRGLDIEFLKPSGPKLYSVPAAQVLLPVLYRDDQNLYY